MKLTRKQQIELLRRISSKVQNPEDAKELRILANQIHKELDDHNKVSRDSRKEKDNIVGIVRSRPQRVD